MSWAHLCAIYCYLECHLIGNHLFVRFSIPLGVSTRIWTLCTRPLKRPIDRGVPPSWPNPSSRCTSACPYAARAGNSVMKTEPLCERLIAHSGSPKAFVPNGWSYRGSLDSEGSLLGNCFGVLLLLIFLVLER